MVERQQTKELPETLRRMLRTAETISNPVSRVDALFMIWGAVFPLGAAGRRTVQEALVNHCLGTPSWKAAYTLREVAIILAGEDREAAERIVEAMPESKYKRQARRRIDYGENFQRRPLFGSSPSGNE